MPRPAAGRRRSTAADFFPNLISDPFRHGLLIAFTASIVMLLLAAGASLMRGERYVHEDADGSPHQRLDRRGHRSRGRRPRRAGRAGRGRRLRRRAERRSRSR